MHVTGISSKPVRVFCLRCFVSISKGGSRERCIGCIDRAGMIMCCRVLSCAFFVSARYHLYRDKFPAVGHGLPVFSLSKDVVDAQGCDTAVVNSWVYFLR